MIALRTASEQDIDAICRIDEESIHDSRRRFIQRVVSQGICHLILAGDRVAAYGVIEDTFFGHGFISMIVVGREYRRRGCGAALLRYLERRAPTEKLFTSTNLSNAPMQALLLREGFVASGLIYNLDEGDPELVYFKKPL